jgi:periplasmic protein CpxP/Spy
MKTRIFSQVLMLSLLLSSQLFAQRGQGQSQGQGQGQSLRAEFMEWKLQKDLGLTAQQIEKMKELREKNQADNTKLREERLQAMKERRQEMVAHIEKRQAEMQKILTPEQYEKWKTMRFEQMEKNMQEGRRGNPGFRPNCQGSNCMGNPKQMNERPNRPQPRRNR